MKDGLSPSHYTVEEFAFILNTCRKARDRAQALRLYACMPQIISAAHTSLWNQLVELLVDLGCVHQAQRVFESLPIRDTQSWNSVITGFVKCGECQLALVMYQNMREDASLQPSEYAFVALLKACIALKDLESGRDIHDAIIARTGLLDRNLFIAGTLVDMYAKCGSLAKAREVFRALPLRDVVLWSTLISGCVEHGSCEEALLCVEQMQHEGISPNSFTLVCSSKACGILKAMDRGQAIHTQIIANGLERELLIGNSLVDMYAKCGSLETAKDVLDKLPVRDIVSWTALIAGYAELGWVEEALTCFKLMQRDKISPNAHTFACSVKACCTIRAVDKGQEVHCAIIEKGFEKELLVGSPLVSMYAKCGLLIEAQLVLDRLPVRDVVSWTALIGGYAQAGASENVFRTFERMVREGVKPNLVSFLNVLNACNHAGLLNKGLAYFEAMSNDHGLTPTLEHYTCIVDLLGRAGHISKVVAMIKEMPCHPDYVLWFTVLVACRKWGNVELARHAFENATRLAEEDTAAYVCMSNIYADSALQEEAGKIEA